jgi:hypothetical protein
MHRGLVTPLNPQVTCRTKDPTRLHRWAAIIFPAEPDHRDVFLHYICSPLPLPLGTLFSYHQSVSLIEICGAKPAFSELVDKIIHSLLVLRANGVFHPKFHANSIAQYPSRYEHATIFLITAFLKSCKLEMPFVTPCTPDISPRTIPSDCIPGEEDRLQPPSNKMHTIGV